MPAWLKVAWIKSRDALHEFLYLVFFALMPVWLGLFVSFISNKGILSFTNNLVYSGESLFICATTIGPLMFFILKEYHRRDDGFSKSFPAKNLLTIFILIICVVSAALIGIRTASNFDQVIEKEYLWYTSVVTIILSLIVWFAVMILKNTIELSPAIMRQDTDDFLEEWRR